MMFTSPWRLAQSIAAAGLLLGCALAASAADTYSAGQLTIPTLTNGPVTYTNVVVGVGAITSGPSGGAAITTVDSLSTATGQITVPTVHVGANTFYNTAVTVASLVSIGSVSGADSYNGTNLTIGYVQVGNSFYRNVVVTVSNIVSNAGGMPTGAWDTYNTGNGQLTIPAVQVGANVYTNVTIKVKGIVSVGTVQGTAQTITYTAPTVGFIPVGASTPISATTNGGLPVTFFVMTPQVCAVVVNTAQVQNFWVSLTATGFAASAVLTGVPVGTNIYQIDSINSIVNGLPLGMLPTTHPVANTFNLPYQPYSADGWEYDNIFYANGSPNFDQGGLGLRGSGTDYNPYYVANFGYLFSDDAIALQTPPEIAMTVTSAEVGGIVGLADGTCNILAFQNGNYYAGLQDGYASATPSMTSLSIGEIILP